MARVQVRDFYDWSLRNAEEDVECEDCGKQMMVPATDDLNADMKEPWWIQEGNVQKSYCEACFSDRVFDKKEGGERP